MSFKRNLARLLIGAFVIISAAACATTATNPRGTATLKVYDPTKWHYWGGDGGQTRYAPLTQIDASNVNRLKVAWRWSADTSGGAASNNYKSTPLLDDGALYTPWLNHGMAAIDAGTGKTLWTYEPQPVDIGTGSPSLALRSLAFWSDGKEKRLFHNSLDGRLIGVDAKTGRPAAGFGNANGWVDLRNDLAPGRQRVNVRSVSPAIVVGDIVVVQVLPGVGGGKEGVPGNVRGYDVHTGKMVWRWNVVPLKGQEGYETWENGSAEFGGNSGTWTMMSVDPELGYVYIAGDTPHNDFSGADRPGANLFAESITCLNAKTGRKVWHFQTVHHGIWDYDNPAAPILHDITVNGKRIKALTQLTKQGFMFVFDRTNGHPVWPIEERPVPQAGAVPGEKLSPTQPFPTRPAPLTYQGYHEEMLIDFTPALRAEAIEIMKGYTKGPLYTPITEVTATNKGTLVNPGFGGGANWNGAAFDPVSNVMFVPIRNRWSAVGVSKGDPARTTSQWVQAQNVTLAGPRGLPIMKPPYSELIAVDMNKGEHLWRTPDGGAPDNVRNSPLLQGLGLDFDHMGQFDIRPGPLVTPTLLFMGEAGTISASRGGDKLRVYDKASGRTLGAVVLPTLSTGAPMTYMQHGKQYIVIAVSAPGKPAELVALTLDGASDNGAAPAAGVPVAAAPPSSTTAATAITATPAELALGAAQFAANCAACHGPAGAGGNGGPRIAGRTDYENIQRVIRVGQAEMPAFGGNLSPAQVEAIAKHVVKTLNAPPPGRGGAGRGGAGGGRGGAPGGGGDD